MSDVLGGIAATLGVSEDRLSALHSYDDDQLAALRALLAGAFEAEDRAFETALEEALELVPRPFRGAAKGLLLGGDRD